MGSWQAEPPLALQSPCWLLPGATCHRLTSGGSASGHSWGQLGLAPAATGPAPSAGTEAVAWAAHKCRGSLGSQRWLNPAAVGKRCVSHAGSWLGQLGRARWLWVRMVLAQECSLAPCAVVHRRGRGPATCSCDRQPQLWWHQQIRDLLSGLGWMGAPGASGTAQLGSVPCHTMPCHTVPAQTGSGPALPSCRGCFGRGCSLGSWLWGEPRGPDLDPPGATAGAGRGCLQRRASKSVSCVGLAVGRGEEQASCSP